MDWNPVGFGMWKAIFEGFLKVFLGFFIGVIGSYRK